MHSLESINAQLKRITNFLTPFLPLANSHLTRYFIEDQWNKFISTKLQDDLLLVPSDKINLIPAAKLYEGEEVLESNEFVNSLRQFLQNVRKYHPLNQDFVTPLHKFSGIKQDLMENSAIIGKTMPQKKAYEVSCMSQVVADICKDKAVDWVVDLGSGLGYLSSFLAVNYGMKVIAIDSSNTNIAKTLRHGQRNEILWKTSEVTKTPESVNQGKIKPAWKKSGRGTTREARSNSNCTSFHTYDGKFIGLTKFVTENEDLLELVSGCVLNEDNDKLPVCSSSRCINRLALVGLHTCGNLAASSIRLYVSNPSVNFICNIGCCYHLIEEKFSSNLLYVNKYENVKQSSGSETSKTEYECKLLLADTRYHCPELNPYLQNRKISEIGFPLSLHLNTEKFSLGRNARMLANNAVDRISKQNVITESLFWRALLDKIVTDQCGKWPENAQVGRRIGKKCKTFNEYCTEGFKNINLNCKITDETIQKYYEKYKLKEDEMNRFYMLKCSLAPVIEGLILLDRLAFLYEQGLTDSHIVQLFDSVVSPRCMGIMSFR